MSYIKDNIRWSIQLSDEAVEQFDALLISAPAQAATIAAVLKELEDDEELERHLSTEGYQTENYKVCYVRKYLVASVHVWRMSINAECNEIFTPLDVRLIYYIDYRARVFKVLDIMPRSANYGENDPEYESKLIKLYQKYSSA